MNYLSVSKKHQILEIYSTTILKYLNDNLAALKVIETGQVAQTSNSSIPDILKFFAFSFGLATGVV